MMIFKRFFCQWRPAYDKWWQGMRGDGQDVTAGRLIVASSGQFVTSSGQFVTSSDQFVTSIGQVLTSSDQGVTRIGLVVTISNQGATSGGQIVKSDTKVAQIVAMLKPNRLGKFVASIVARL
jgi:hypothetical protein